MKKLKRNQGITLIALVITIIVLLILAGISIQGLTGSGIFEKAKQAIEKSKYANALEKVKLAVTASYDESGNINNEFLKDNLNAIEGKEGELVEGENDITVKVDEYLFLVSKTTGEVSRKNIEIADGGVDNSREIDEEEYNNLKYTVADMSNRLNNMYTKEQVNQLINNTSTSASTLPGQNWTLLKKIKVTDLNTANNNYKWSSGDSIDITPYSYFVLGHYGEGSGLFNFVMISKTEFLKYDSATNFIYANTTVGNVAAYISSGKIYLRKKYKLY